MSRGAEAVYAILGGGGSREESIRLRESVLRVVRSASDLSEASGQSSRRLVASVSPPVKWSWAFLTHPFLGWGPGRPGILLKGRCLTRRRSRRECSGGLGLSVSFLLAPLCHPNRPLQLLVPRKSWK